MGNSVVDLGQGGFRPEISFSGGIMESTPQIASIDGDPVYGDLRTKQASGRIGGSYETSSGDVFGAGVSGGMEKSRLELPSSLQAFGAPARIDRGEGKIVAQSYDAFAELSDVFGIEGAKALIRGNYTPSSMGEDSYEAGVNLSIPFENGGEVGIMSALLDPRIDLPNSAQQTAVRQSGREGSALSSQFYPEGSLTFEQILETKYGYPSDVDREIYESDSTEVMRAERPRHDLPTYQELEDARAHALQTALLAQELGPKTATKLGGIAEFSDRIFSSATSEDVVMDKRNNAFGAKLLQQAGINATPQQITKMVDDEVFKQLDVVLGREKGERRFKSPESGLDIFFPRDKQGFFNVTR
tara:strand:+ start:3101 stop:4171 length:1071 start_codon:yes stop_codon:yes gene_type:complete